MADRKSRRLHHSTNSCDTSSSSPPTSQLIQSSTASYSPPPDELSQSTSATGGRKRKLHLTTAPSPTTSSTLDFKFKPSNKQVSVQSSSAVKISERKAKSNAIRALNKSTGVGGKKSSSGDSATYNLFDELHHSTSSSSSDNHHLASSHRVLLQQSLNEEREVDGQEEDESDTSEFAVDHDDETQLSAANKLFKKRSNSGSSSTSSTPFYTSPRVINTRRSSRTLSNNDPTTTTSLSVPRKKPRLSNTTTSTTASTVSKSNEKTGSCISKHSSAAITTTRKSTDKSKTSSTGSTSSTETTASSAATTTTQSTSDHPLSFKIRKSNKMSSQQQQSTSKNPPTTSTAQQASSTTNNDSTTTAAANESANELNRLTDLLQSRGLSSQLVNAFGSKVQQFLHRTISASSSTTNANAPQASSSNTSNSSTGSSGGLGGRSGYLITSLQQSDENVKLTALTEMCQLLVMGNEETLAGFPMKQAVPLLLQCMSSSAASDFGAGGDNYELMNHACRALTYMMDALPRSTSLIADGISIFLEKLHTIECMDVAEQALTALEILSRRHAKQIVNATQAGSVSACLLYLDFFSIVAQRNALKITANCAHAMHDQSEFVHIQSSLPVLAQRLCVAGGDASSVDKRSVETVCAVFARLVDNFQRYPHILKELASHQVVENMQQILIAQPPVVSSATLISIMHTLFLMLTNCNELSVGLVENKSLLNTLRHLFVGGEHATGSLASASSNQISSLILSNRTPPELLELVSLTAELLPRLPRDSTHPLFSIDDALRKSNMGQSLTNESKIHWEWRDTTGSGQWRSYSIQDSNAIEQAYLHVEDECIINNAGRTYIIDFNSLLQINEETGTARPVARRVLNVAKNTNESTEKDHRLDHLNSKPDLYAELIHSMFKIIYEVYASAAGPALKHRSLRTLLRMVYYGSRLTYQPTKTPLLHELLRDLPISSQIASMLANYVTGDYKTVVSALQLAQILIKELPDIFGVYFRREGVLYQIDKLIESYEANTTTTSDNNNNKTTVKTKATTSSRPANSSASASLAQAASNVNASDLTSSKRKIRSTTLPTTSNAISSKTESTSSKPIAASAQSSTSSTAALVYPATFPFLPSLSTSTSPPAYQQQQSLPNNLFSTTSRIRRATTNVSTTQSLPAAQQQPQQTSGSSNKSTQQAAALLEQTQCQQNRDIVKKWILDQARAFKQRHFNETPSTSKSSSSGDKANVLDKLREANDSLSVEDVNNNVNNLNALKKIFGVLADTDVSSFELIHSGFVVKLASFLTPKSGITAEASTHQHYGHDLSVIVKNEKSMHHIKQFLHVVCGLPVKISEYNDQDQQLIHGQPDSDKFSRLVNKLQQCVQQLESFEVRGVYDVPGMSGAGTKNAAIKYFNTHQIKCMLQRHDESAANANNTIVGGLRQWRSGYVKVDPLALVSAVERYLLMRGIVASSTSTVNPRDTSQLSVTGTGINNTSSMSTLATGLSTSLPNTSNTTDNKKSKSSKTDKKTTAKTMAKSEPKDIKTESSKSKSKKKKESSSKKASTSSMSKNIYETLLFGSAASSTGAASGLAFEEPSYEDDEHNYEVMEDDEDNELYQDDLDEDDEMEIGNNEEDEEDTFHEEINHDDEFDDGEDDEDDFDEDEDDEDEEANYFGQASNQSAQTFLFGGSSATTTSGLQLSSMPRLTLLINGHVLPSNMTIYQAIKQFGDDGASVSADVSSMSLDTAATSSLGSIWAKVHLITYKLADDSKQEASNSKRSTRQKSSSDKPSQKASTDTMSQSDLNLDMSATQHFSALFNNRSKFSTNLTDKSTETIILLSLLNELNRHWPLEYSSLYQMNGVASLIAQQEFINTKLTAKANRQLQDPLVIMTGHLPNWLPVLMQAAPFLFPFDTRLLYFFQSRMDRDRALQKLNDLVPDLNSHGASGADSSGSAGSGAGSGSGLQGSGNGSSSASGSDRLQPKLERKKRTISRYEDLIKQSDAILNEFCINETSQAVTAFSNTGYKPALLEIQYENEVGTGLGPTLEFYSLVSLELQKSEHEMWRGEKVKLNKALGMNQQDQLFFVPHAGSQGLYPAPLYVSSNKPSSKQQGIITKLKQKFKFMGKLMAKALMDNRVLDIPLSLPFYKWLVAPSTLCLEDLKHVDASLYRSVESLKDYIRKRRLILLNSDNSKSTTKVNKQLAELEKSVAELELDFTMPGTTFELKKGGKDLSVTLNNLDEYIHLVVDWTLIRGVQTQMDAFKEGFDQILSIDGLKQFYPEELERLFCGSGYVAWDRKTLIECTRCDHGFTHESKAVEYLFDIMCSFNHDEQRLFLQFVTGSPRLPLGGLRSLTPRLTIVRKTVDTGTTSTNSHKERGSKSKSQNHVKPSPDDYLPSVMTCVNYLKLPDYSSTSVMRDKLMKAMCDGQLSFHLS